MPRGFLKTRLRTDIKQDPDKKKRGFLRETEWGTGFGVGPETRGFLKLPEYEFPEIPPVSGRVTAEYTPELGIKAGRDRLYKLLHSEIGLPKLEWENLSQDMRSSLLETGEDVRPAAQYVGGKKIEGDRVQAYGKAPSLREKYEESPVGTFEKKFIKTVNPTLFNVGGIDVSLADIVGLGLIAYGGYQALSEGIPKAYQSLVNTAVTRNVDKLSKETGVILDKTTRSNFIQALTQKLVQTQKPSWLTRQSIKEIFKPSGKAGLFKTTAQSETMAEDSFAPLVRQTYEQLSKFTATKTGVPGMTMTQADILKAIQGITPATAEAIATGRAELKPQIPKFNAGDVFVNAEGKKLTVVEWKPNAGLAEKGKYLLKNDKGITSQLSTSELTERGYNPEKPTVAPVAGVTPPEVPVATPEFAEADAGLQRSMLAEVPEREVRIKGKGEITQASMDDYLKLKNYNAPQAARRIDEINGLLYTKGRLPKGQGNKVDLKIELARLEAQNNLTFVRNTDEMDSLIGEVEYEMSARGQPYHGGLKAGPFARKNGDQLDEMYRVYNQARQEFRQTPETAPTTLTPTAVPTAIQPAPPVPPAEPPVTAEVPAQPPAPPSLNEMKKVVAQATEVVKQDRPGRFTKILQMIPGIKQIIEFERPGLQMTGDKEKILIAHVAESQARNAVASRATGTCYDVVSNMKSEFGKQALHGGKTKVKFIGTTDQSKNPITGTIKDMTDNPELYETTTEQKTLFKSLDDRNSELLNLVVDGYGAEIGRYPAKEGGAFLPNVDVSEDVIEAIGSELRAVASGRQKTRFYVSARDRMAHDKTFKPELDIEKLIIGMDNAKSASAGGQTFRTVLDGKDKLQVMQETHSELAKKMDALKKRLQGMRGTLARLDEKQSKAIDDFLKSPLEDVDLTYLQAELDPKVGRAFGKPWGKAGVNLGKDITAMQKEVEGVKAQIKALRKSWEVANLKPYQFVQEGIYRYFPADQAKLIIKLRKVSNNPILRFIENVRGTAFSGDLSPIVGVQTPIGIFADPVGAFQQAGGGIVKAIKNADPFTSLKVSDLAQDIQKNPDDWSQFFSLLGRAPSGTPQEFAGGFLSKIPGFSEFTEATFLVVTRQAKGLYDRTWTQLVKFGVPELTAKVSAITTTARVYPFLNPARLGQSPARAALIRSLPTSYSFIRKPAEMMVDAAKGFAKLPAFQKPTPTEWNSMKLILTLAASLMVTSAISQAINAKRKGNDVKQAMLDAINPNPENGKFLSITFGNYRVPIGGPYRALFRAIYPKEISGIPVPVPFAGLITYLNNRLNPAARAQLDLWANKDYYGQKIRSGDVPEQILRILEYEIESALPLTAGSVLEAYRTDMTQEQMATQAISQFAGVSLVENKWYDVNSLRDKYAQSDYGISYDELNKAQKDELLRKHSDLKSATDEAQEETKKRGEELPKIYSLLSEQAETMRNTKLNSAAQSLIDGKITKEQYDNERSYIRPYYSGQKNALWQMKSQLDPVQAKELENYFNESSKPEDKAMDTYWEFYNQTIESMPLPKDWDVIDQKMTEFLNQYDARTQEYILKNKDNWILELPEPARSLEIERTAGIADESWWDNYRGTSYTPTKPKQLFPTSKGKLTPPSWEVPEKEPYTPYPAKSKLKEPEFAK